MRALILSISAFSLVACGRPTEEQLLEGAYHGHPLHLENSTSERVAANMQMGAREHVSSWNKNFRTPHIIQNQVEVDPGRTNLDTESLKEIALQSARSAFPGYEFQADSVREGKALSYVTLQQMHQNRKVVGAEVTVQLDAKGEWVKARSSLVALDILQRLQKLERPANVYAQVPSSVKIIEDRPVVYPLVKNSEVEVHWAREIQVASLDLQRAYILFVSEITGQVLGIYNPEHHFQEGAAANVTGTIYPNDPGSEPVRMPLPFVQMKVADQIVNADAEGTFALDKFLGQEGVITLKNPRISVINNGGDDNKLSVSISEETGAIDMDAGSIADERNIYYWVMKTHEFIEKNLGYNGMNFPMVAMARDGMEMDNAYFNPLFSKIGAPVLAFGTGKNLLKNTALSRDVVIHEFGHALTWKIYGMKATYEFSAMNEAFSDYLAATISDNPTIGEGGMISRPYLRTVENDLVYPKGYKGSYFHEDGQIFSGALWETRKTLGAHADTLIHEARLSRADGVAEFMGAMMEADDLLDKDRDNKMHTLSPNFHAIRKAFLKKGINSQVVFNQGPPEDLTIPWKKKHLNCWQHSADVGLR